MRAPSTYILSWLTRYRQRPVCSSHRRRCTNVRDQLSTGSFLLGRSIRDSIRFQCSRIGKLRSACNYSGEKKREKERKSIRISVLIDAGAPRYLHASSTSFSYRPSSLLIPLGLIPPSYITTSRRRAFTSEETTT